MKKMPYTAFLFLIGSLAICGLPPFNGFISEYLIYMGMFKSLSAANLFQSMLILGTIVGLSLIGGLAIFCFTKAFGIAFLGEPRSEHASSASEVGKNMIFPQYITVVFILLIGLGSGLIVKPVFSIVAQTFRLSDAALTTGPFITIFPRSVFSRVYLLLLLLFCLFTGIIILKANRLKQDRHGDAVIRQALQGNSILQHPMPIITTTLQNPSAGERK